MRPFGDSAPRLCTDCNGTCVPLIPRQIEPFEVPVGDRRDLEPDLELGRLGVGLEPRGGGLAHAPPLLAVDGSDGPP